MTARLSVLAVALLAAGCATKWSGAPTTEYPSQKLVTKVQWLPAGPAQYDVIAAATGIRCCMIPQDEIRNPVIEAVKRKAAVLCSGEDRFSIENGSYDMASESYGARVVCKP